MVCEREQFAGCTVKRTLVIYYLDEAPKRSAATNRAKRAVIKYPYAFSEREGGREREREREGRRKRKSKSGEGAPRRRVVVTSASGAEKTSPSMRRCGYVVTSLPAPLAAALTCPERVTNDERGITTRKLCVPFVLSSRLDCNASNVSVRRIMRPFAEAHNHPLVVFFERLECRTSRDIRYWHWHIRPLKMALFMRLFIAGENAQRGLLDCGINRRAVILRKSA